MYWLTDKDSDQVLHVEERWHTSAITCWRRSCNTHLIVWKYSVLVEWH